MSKKQLFFVRASVRAVQLAVLSMSALTLAHAQDAAELTKPVNSIEVGVVVTDKDSFKFGEYNDLQKKGAHVVGNIELNGGDGATRYKLTGDAHGFGAEYGSQGLFKVTFGYDEMHKYRSDSYMTPYLGVGTDNLTLPASWETNRKACAISSTSSGNTNFGGASNATAGTAGCGNYYVNANATTGNKTAAPVGNAGALTDAELAAFALTPLQTKRATTNLGVSFNISPQWKISARNRYEEKDGTQAIGQAIGGAAANSVVLPNPIKYKTNQLELKLNFAAGPGFAELGYYGSIFEDQIKSLTYQNPWFSSATPSVSSSGAVTYPYPDAGRFATAPGNEFHQWYLTAGYNFGNNTKLVANASHGRNTQTETYLPAGTVSAATGTTPTTWVVPRTNLGGEVITTDYSLKLTSRPIRSLNLLASYKESKRDNNSSVASYTTPFNPQDGQIAVTNFPYNLAYSRDLKQGNVEADWSFSRGQAVKLAYETLDVNRWCNGMPASAASCVNASDASEKSTRVEYRNAMWETVNGRISYVNSERTASTYVSNVSYYAGDLLTRFNMTDRARDKVRAALNWAPTETLDFSVTYEDTKDSYTLGRNPTGNLLLGLESMHSTAWNLDATLRLSEKVSLNAFYSDEDMSSLLRGDGASNTTADTNALNAVAGGAYWSVDMRDKVKTWGLNLRATELMGGKLDLSAGYLSSRGTSPYAVTAASYLAYSSGALPTLPAQTLTNTLIRNAVPGFPDTYANSDAINLTAKYVYTKNTTIKLSFLHQKYSSADPAFYNGLQAGAVNAQAAPSLSTSGVSATTKVNGTLLPANSVFPYSTLFPSNEQAPNYTVNAIGLGFVYSF